MPRLVFAALVFASLELAGCASVLRSSTQPVWFRNAPDDLIVLHDGDQIPLARREGGNRLGELPVKAEAVTQKWKNFGDVHVQVALAAAHQTQPARTAVVEATTTQPSPPQAELAR